MIQEQLELPVIEDPLPPGEMPDGWQCMIVRQPITREAIVTAGLYERGWMYPRAGMVYRYSGPDRWTKAVKKVRELCGWQKRLPFKIRGKTRFEYDKPYPLTFILKEFEK